ncbi:MAG TPA: phosphate-starvation-inducible PsiE family protein [Candidatus Competibacteraceae bacterium]|nr:phosphate-starvation-inducible PsiE family protein [Candidatus Competibacteraceae bacterium]HPF59679.1 phosphate-starvation-inducible PsiE family protein [Candidatus Competibacteraceae bacterium]HRY19200.1 phosphate-starvation-inducible PsiE family protein [Candidatus Competibacteraceae bacterium]
MEKKSETPLPIEHDPAEGLNINEKEEPLIHGLHIVIRFCVRILAVLITLVIMWSVADVAWVLSQRIMMPPVGLLNVNDILALFGTFMATLIAIEIFLNIVLYLRDDVLHVKLVLATALMAIARKVIVLDYKVLEPEYIWATAAVIFALSIGYWLVAKKT